MAKSFTPSVVGMSVVCLLAAAGTASAQTCSNGVVVTQCTPLGNCNGADVIVGDVNGISNYTNVGTIDAISIGTTSCNIGNFWLNWISNTNQHPAISQSFFKLKTQAAGYTTYEQVGQSWLKHGFFALSENLCCAGCQATNGSHLGVHCSDPYTSGRNGSQSGLGPKWQVNANTGVFTYPPANPAWSGSVARRVQLNAAELEVSSASVKYVAAAQYVTPDDAAAGNKFNNESYRLATLSGSGSAWNATPSGTTQRAQQAIRAWADNAVGVTETDIMVPSEGLFIVAAAVTPIAGGLWHYEYAVQNMCSDRSGQAFSVPMPSGVTVTNIGFHDVAYHSGDGNANVNFDGTDWAASKTNGSVSDGSPMTWATQTVAQNANANALRWGTLYNFRFDADVAPISGQVEIALFKTGTPSSVLSGATALPIPSAPVGVPCDADWDGDGTVGVPDIFAFLADWFAEVPEAFNYGGTGGVPAIFAFLTEWFAHGTGPC